VAALPRRSSGKSQGSFRKFQTPTNKLQKSSNYQIAIYLALGL